MLSEWDGLPVKSKLPPEVEAGFKTRSQWEEQNLYPKDDARPVRMHPSPPRPAHLRLLPCIGYRAP